MSVSRLLISKYKKRHYQLLKLKNKIKKQNNI